VGAFFVVVWVSVETSTPSHDLLCILPTFRRGARGTVVGCVSRRTTLVTMAAVVVPTFIPSLEGFETFTDGVSNDRCNGSSSKNKCNGKLNLNHF
jgi:hypothetical protein